jgi:hypothetical protein
VVCKSECVKVGLCKSWLVQELVSAVTVVGGKRCKKSVCVKAVKMKMMRTTPWTMKMQRDFTR